MTHVTLWGRKKERDLFNSAIHFLHLKDVSEKKSKSTNNCIYHRKRVTKELEEVRHSLYHEKMFVKVFLAADAKPYD
jgi:hypothetical protein